MVFLTSCAGCGRTVRRVTRRACHLPSRRRMMGGLEKVGALCLMASRADIGLGRGRLYRIFRGVHRMTAGAGNVAGRVCAGRPVVRRIRLVAAQTLGILYRRRRRRFRAEVHHSGQGASACFYMRTARSMAGLALQGRRGRRDRSDRSAARVWCGKCWSRSYRCRDSRDRYPRPGGL